MNSIPQDVQTSQSDVETISYEEFGELREENARLYGEVQSSRIVQQEKDLVLAAYRELELTIGSLRSELDYTKMQLQRTEASEAEMRRLQRKVNSILAICAVSHNVLGPSQKIALITGPEQTPYPASYHGGSAETMLMSIKKWAESTGGDVSKFSNIVKPLEACGVVTRTEIDLQDGKKHYQVEFNENLIQHPRLINPDAPRPHNGGDKRCPQCGNYCKKRLTIKYECEKCGIDFDQNMTPIDHPVEHAVVTPSTPPVNVVPEPAPAQESLGDAEWQRLMENAGYRKGRAS